MQRAKAMALSRCQAIFDAMKLDEVITQIVEVDALRIAQIR